MKEYIYTEDPSSMTPRAVKHKVIQELSTDKGIKEYLVYYNDRHMIIPQRGIIPEQQYDNLNKINKIEDKIRELGEEVDALHKERNFI